MFYLVKHLVFMESSGIRKILSMMRLDSNKYMSIICSQFNAPISKTIKNLKTIKVR